MGYMVIAEALNERKDYYTKAKALASQIAAEAIVEKKNPEVTAETIAVLVAALHGTMQHARQLTVDINEANNRETVTVGADTLSLMEAIALRDQLTLLHVHRTSILDAIEVATGRRRDRYGFGSRRSKADIKEVSLIDRDAFRKENDALAEQRRLLDIEIQKVNWSASL